MSVRVLVIDDSRIFRSLLQEVLEKNGDFQVVSSVWSGDKALDFLRSNSVDLITLDVEMPAENGLMVLSRLKRELPDLMGQVPVIMLSSYTQSGSDVTLQALEQGAFDFIPKPSIHEDHPEEYLFHQVQQKWIAWNHQKRKWRKPRPEATPIHHKIHRAIEKEYPRKKVSKPAPGKKNLLLIGVSTGGPKALSTLLPQLCEKISSPIVIVQHMPPHFTQSLAASLDKKCNYQFFEAEEGMRVQAKCAYIAPGGSHLSFSSVQGNPSLHVHQRPPENGCRPSVSVLFRSSLRLEVSKIQYLILTGMGADGANTLSDIKENGGNIAAQDEASSVVWGMPGAAFATGTVDDLVDLEALPKYLAERVE